MDIAAVSIGMSSARLQQNVGLSVAKKAMDQQETEGAALLRMLQSAQPPSTHILDVKA